MFYRNKKNHLLYVALIFSLVSIACVHASEPPVQSELERKVENAILKDMDETRYEATTCVGGDKECVVTYSFLEEEEASRIAHRAEGVLNNDQDEKVTIITKKSAKYELICSLLFGIGVGLAAVVF